MSLADVATISITAATRGISRQGFGQPAILAQKFPGSATELVLEYSTDAEMAAAGWETGDPARILAQAMFSQPNKNIPIKILNGDDFTTVTTLVLTPTFLPAEGETVRLTISHESGVATINEVVAPAATLTTLLAALAGSIMAAVPAVTAVGSPTDITITSPSGDFVHVDIDQALNPLLWLFEDLTTLDAGLSARLDLIQGIDPDWYGFVSVQTSAAMIAGIYTWAEANGKLYLARTADSDVLDGVLTTDVASVAQAASLGRSGVVHHPVHSDALAPGLLASQLAAVVGSSHWVYKVVTGSVAPKYSTSQRSSMDAKAVTYAVSALGVTATRGGKVAAGEWIDLVRLIDFFRARIPEDVYQTQLNNPKIAMTDKGIRVLVSVIEGRLVGKIGQGIADDPAPTVEAPRARDIPTSDRIARTLPNVEFTAQLEGAIILTQITGTLTP